MGFRCGIVGLPNVGKSTLFNALTTSKKAQAENFPFCTIDPNVGIVAVPDKRLNKIIIEASEQSNRLKVPKLEKILKLNEFLKLNQNINIIFGDLNTDNSKINFKSSDPLCILIGPEGDFTLKERKNILKLKKLISLKINQNILRSETAAISMISIITFNLLS